MLNRKLALVIGSLGLLAGCPTQFGGDDGPRRTPGARMDHAAARTAIGNPGPGDMDLLVGDPRAAPHAIIDARTIAPADTTALAGPGIGGTATKRTLVLYDRGGPWGSLGELYAIGGANFASHFGSWTAKPATTYTCGELATYDAALYFGSTYDEPLPTCLLDEVLAGTRPVIWSAFNLWQLTQRAGWDAFIAARGFTWTALDFSPIDGVLYKGRTLARYAANQSGLLATTITDPTKAAVLAIARRADGTTLPWAVRSGNLTYVAELPFTYMTEEDRYLVYADLLFDALAPAATERHRVVLRIEDISPVDDPEALRALADYLYAQNVPFGFGVIAEYRDPLGYYNGGAPETVRLEQAPDLVAALQYMQARGGVMIMHGYTHQRDKLLNPYTGVTGDDTEFYRVIENDDHTLTYVGPVGNDTIKSTLDRVEAARRQYRRAKLAPPTLFEFPHYAGSANSYRAIAQAFTTRWERTLYVPGLLSTDTASYSTISSGSGLIFGQLFPYVVRDVYGTRVIPENLGNIEPEPFYIFPTRFPADIINAAEKNLVVRDGVTGFYFHPFFDLQYLRDTVQGLRALGYTFVSPDSL